MTHRTFGRCFRRLNNPNSNAECQSRCSQKQRPPRPEYANGVKIRNLISCFILLVGTCVPFRCTLIVLCVSAGLSADLINVLNLSEGGQEVEEEMKLGFNRTPEYRPGLHATHHCVSIRRLLDSSIILHSLDETKKCLQVTNRYTAVYDRYRPKLYEVVAWWVNFHRIIGQ